jgi:hypothetical protein
MPEFGGWHYSTDREATVRAYRHALQYPLPECDCLRCRNFALVLPLVFPAAFLAFLDRLGVDSACPSDVLGSEDEERRGVCFYEGWFHFVGTTDESGESPEVAFGPSFSATMAKASWPALPGMGDEPLLQIEWSCWDLPWLLHEPQPGYDAET